MITITIIAIALMLIISATFAATETAITASSPSKIQKLKSDGERGATLAAHLLKSKEQVISSMLIGNSMVNTICTTVATGLFIELLGDDTGTIVSSAVMSVLIIIFAEVVPKAIAVAKAERFICFISPFVKLALKITGPVNTILDMMVKKICWLFRIDLNHELSGSDEVRGVIEHQHQEGNVYKTDRDMLESILDINDMSVAEIMIHRSNIMALDINLSNNEIIPAALSSPFTRIPLWQESKDNIIGILHIKDLLRALHSHNNDMSKIRITEVMSQPWFIPDNSLVSKQLHLFRERKNHFACVVDEYGDLQGILTLEDVIEVIVGQIEDEHDLNNEMIIKKNTSEYLIKGSVTIRDLNRELNWDLPDEHANTIAGLIIHTAERIPSQGEKLKLFDLEITIVKKVANRIENIKITVLNTLT